MAETNKPLTSAGELEVNVVTPVGPVASVRTSAVTAPGEPNIRLSIVIPVYREGEAARPVIGAAATQAPQPHEIVQNTFCGT